MRAFWAVVAASLLLGAGAIWSLVDAVSEYTGALRTYSRLQITYEPNSFIWLEPDFSSCRATVIITNGSPADARLENLRLNVYFDGEFAGSTYERVPTLTVARGESVTLDVEMQVTSRSIQANGGQAVLHVSGSADAHFRGIERSLQVPIYGNVGQVDVVEPS